MEEKARATQEDVAKLAGVSQAIVSYIVNNKPDVSIPERTRNRVKKAMRDLGYIPNIIAKSLRSGSTDTIGLIIPDNSNPFFAEIARMIENAGYHRGYSVILCNSDGDIEKENQYIDVLVSKQVDGIIFISAGGDQTACEKLRKSQTPFIITDRDLPEIEADSVLLDNEYGGYLATKHLLELGHRKIGCISGPSRFSPSIQRVRGYEQALTEYGLPIIKNYIVQGDFRLKSGEIAMDRLFDLDPAISAVFSCNDIMAAGAIQSIRKHGKKIPDDISIVGFDDIPVITALFPELTTVSQPLETIASEAVELLMNRINGSGVKNSKVGFQRIILKPVLVQRGSTRSLEKAL